MDAQIKTKWIEALRSGKYVQTDGTLHDHVAGSFCCLGVLCDVMGAEWRKGDAYLNGEMQTSYLSPIALQTAGLDDMQQEKLWRMNDDGTKFEEIANHIEKHL